MKGTLRTNDAGRFVITTERPPENAISRTVARLMQREAMSICKCRMVDADTITICDNCKEALTKN